MAKFSFTSIDDTLKELEQGLTQIMANPYQALDMNTYLRLYTLIHDHMAYDKDRRSSQSTSFADAHSATLYKWLNHFLRKYLTQLSTELAKQDAAALKASYAEKLKGYEAAAKYNSHIFRQLERHWILREQDEGNTKVHTIYKLHIVRWREDILQNESIGKAIGPESLLEERDSEQFVGKDQPHDKAA